MRTPVKPFNVKDWIVILVLLLLGLSLRGTPLGRAGVEGANDIFVDSG